MKYFLNKYIAIVTIILLGACSTKDELTEDWINTTNGLIDPPTAGSLDLSSYVAVGNSVTAGFSDAALYPEGQANSLPSILSNQFTLAGGGAFTFPDISSGNGFGGIDGSAIIGKSFIDLEAALAALAGQGSIGDAIQFTEGTLLNNSTNTGASLNNFGVPGARVIDLTVAGYGTANPYFGAFQSSAAATVLGDATSANGSFFSLWIGSNDVLGYAVSGGVAGEDFNALDPRTITGSAEFAAALTATLDALSANGAQGVLLNIPPLTILPFFQTVTTLSGGINLIPLERQGQVDSLNAGYAAYNAGLDAVVGLVPGFTQDEADARKISFVVGANPPVITDESLTDLTGANPALISMRQATVDATTGSTDLFPLTALDSIGVERVEGNSATTLGVSIPLPDEFSLTLDEQVNVITAYATFNAIIEGEAVARANVSLVDVGPLFADVFGLIPAQAAGLQMSAASQLAADGVLGTVVSGITLEPLSLSAEALYNSLWSTDGIHPNPRGAGLVANEIIEVLNEENGATIPSVNVLDLPAINAPF